MEASRQEWMVVSLALEGEVAASRPKSGRMGGHVFRDVDDASKIGAEEIVGLLASH